MNIHKRLGFLALSVCFLAPVFAQAAEKYRFGVPPVLEAEETVKLYQPLVDYMSKKAGIEIELVPARNFLGYWQRMRRSDFYDLLLDSSHLGAYRKEKMGHRLLARMTGVLSFTLISRPDDLIIDPEELLNRKVAVMPSPNLGAIKIYNTFPNPARQPSWVEVKNVFDALEAVRSERADAAYVPTPMLSRYPEATVITSSEPIPNMTMTASPRVPPEVADKISRALLEANKTKEGRAMLKAVNIVSFEPVDSREYVGLEKMMSGIWGY